MSSGSGQNCNCSAGCCDVSNRRDFLRIVGFSAAAIAGAMPVMAGPFEATDLTKVAPPDKKLDRRWIQSLFARGTRTVYRGADLQKIGMPIGGICTGQVYLGGDGRLWHWDIFNQFISTESSGPHYANPPKPDFPIEQGFAVRIRSEAKDVVRTLDHSGFSNISFTGEYPIGFVEYRDPRCPVAVSLEAFSPFIPLSPHDSHLPATILQFTVKNTSSAKVECELAGWLQNAVCLHSAKATAGTRTNTIARQQGITLLDCTAAPSASPAKQDRPPIALADQPDYGSMSLAMFDAQADDMASAAAPSGVLPQNLFGPSGLASDPVTTKDIAGRIVGALGRKLSLSAGQQATVTFVVAWHFPTIQHLGLKDIKGRQYGKRFASARAVAEYIAANFARLAQQTRLWHATWYDSTLPYWFLDRTFLTMSLGPIQAHTVAPATKVPEPLHYQSHFVPAVIILRGSILLRLGCKRALSHDTRRPLTRKGSFRSKSRRSFLFCHRLDQPGSRVVEEVLDLCRRESQPQGREAHCAELLIADERHRWVAVRQVEGMIALGQERPGVSEGDVFASGGAGGQVVAPIHHPLRPDAGNERLDHVGIAD